MNTGTATGQDGDGKAISDSDDHSLDVDDDDHNDCPIATNDSGTTNEAASMMIDVLANDSDPKEDDLE